jgi:hypothetical protein
MDTNTVRFMAIPVLGEIENVKSLSAKFAELKQRTCRARLRSFYRCEIMESTILNPLFYPNLVMADWKQATFTSHNVRTLPISPYVEIASQNRFAMTKRKCPRRDTVPFMGIRTPNHLTQSPLGGYEGSKVK